MTYEVDKALTGKSRNKPILDGASVISYLKTYTIALFEHWGLKKKYIGAAASAMTFPHFMESTLSNQNSLGRDIHADRKVSKKRIIILKIRLEIMSTLSLSVHKVS